MLSSFLCSVVLAGIFSAVSELILPSRIFAVGRLLRALCAVFVVAIIVTPILRVGLGEGVEESMQDTLFSSEEEVLLSKPIETHVFALACQKLEEQITPVVQGLLGQAAEVKVSFQTDIFLPLACIYCDKPEDQAAVLAARRVSETFGIECLRADKGAKDE